MSAIKIDKKIVKYKVTKPNEKPRGDPRETDIVRNKDGRKAEVIRMHEKLVRPEVLIGSTYKIKTPVSDHAMYVTINDIVLNEGTEHEQRRPFEATRRDVAAIDDELFHILFPRQPAGGTADKTPRSQRHERPAGQEAHYAHS